MLSLSYLQLFVARLIYVICVCLCHIRTDYISNMRMSYKKQELLTPDSSHLFRFLCCVLFAQCCQFLWIVPWFFFFLLFIYHLYILIDNKYSRTKTIFKLLYVRFFTTLQFSLMKYIAG